MSILGFEPLLRTATIKTLDKISRKVDEAETKTENAVTRLLKRWRELDADEKEQVIGIVIATASTAVAAVAALKSGKKRVAKKAGKSVIKTIAKRIK